MHLFLLTRGVEHGFVQWKKFMETKGFIFPQTPILKDKDGNPLKNPDGSFQYGPTEYKKVFGALRPIMLCEYVFPEGPDDRYLKEVLGMLSANKDYNKLRPEVASIAWILRKGLGGTKIPDMPDITSKDPYELTRDVIPPLGVAVYPIGIRRDPVKDFEFESGAYKQEGL